MFPNDEEKPNEYPPPRRGYERMRHGLGNPMHLGSTWESTSILSGGVIQGGR